MCDNKSSHWLSNWLPQVKEVEQNYITVTFIENTLQNLKKYKHYSVGYIENIGPTGPDNTYILIVEKSVYKIFWLTGRY